MRCDISTANRTMIVRCWITCGRGEPRPARALPFWMRLRRCRRALETMSGLAATLKGLRQSARSAARDRRGSGANRTHPTRAHRRRTCRSSGPRSPRRAPCRRPSTASRSSSARSRSRPEKSRIWGCLRGLRTEVSSRGHQACGRCEGPLPGPEQVSFPVRGVSRFECDRITMDFRSDGWIVPFESALR
jgi:hypothetical protein